MTNHLGRPTTNADVLEQRVINFSALRTKDAVQNNAFYDIVAYNTHTRQIWIRRDGKSAYCLNWNTFECTCPDMVNVRKLQKACRDADMPEPLLLCKHVGHVTECIARKLKERGSDIRYFQSEWGAIIVAYPNLPGNWDIDNDCPDKCEANGSAPSARLMDVPRATLERQRTADYAPPYHQA